MYFEVQGGEFFLKDNDGTLQTVSAGRYVAIYLSILEVYSSPSHTPEPSLPICSHANFLCVPESKASKTWKTTKTPDIVGHSRMATSWVRRTKASSSDMMTSTKFGGLRMLRPTRPTSPMRHKKMVRLMLAERLSASDLLGNVRLLATYFPLCTDSW